MMWAVPMGLDQPVAASSASKSRFVPDLEMQAPSQSAEELIKRMRQTDIRAGIAVENLTCRSPRRWCFP